MTERLHFHFSLSCTGEGNGNPLQYSCPENPMDREAWWATVQRVAKSRTQLSTHTQHFLKVAKSFVLPFLFFIKVRVRGAEYNHSQIVKRLDFYQIRSDAQSCPTLCDPMNRSMPGLPVHHQLPEFTQTQVHRVSDAIQPSHPLSSPSPLAPNPP